ncbi:MAG: hypothetical protein Q8836_02655, partial [Sweet potato little leaf phytoplasma]|nr:hypothetical protein [Sweet potato little leaf phytoplasma]
MTTFADFILRIGNGEEPTYNDDIITLPQEIAIPHFGSNMEMEFIRKIYPDIQLHATSMEYMTNILTIEAQKQTIEDRDLTIKKGDQIIEAQKQSSEDRVLVIDNR